MPGRTDADVYLTERSKPRDGRVSVSGVVEAFDDLASVMEPEVVVNLRLVKEVDMGFHQLRQTLRNEATEKRHTILYEEAF